MNKKRELKDLYSLYPFLNENFSTMKSHILKDHAINASKHIPTLENPSDKIVFLKAYSSICEELIKRGETVPIADFLSEDIPTLTNKIDNNFESSSVELEEPEFDLRGFRDSNSDELSFFESCADMLSVDTGEPLAPSDPFSQMFYHAPNLLTFNVDDFLNGKDFEENENAPTNKVVDDDFAKLFYDDSILLVDPEEEFEKAFGYDEAYNVLDGIPSSTNKLMEDDLKSSEGADVVTHTKPQEDTIYSSEPIKNMPFEPKAPAIINRIIDKDEPISNSAPAEPKDEEDYDALITDENTYNFLSDINPSIDESSYNSLETEVQAFTDKEPESSIEEISDEIIEGDNSSPLIDGSIASTDEPIAVSESNEVDKESEIMPMNEDMALNSELKATDTSESPDITLQDSGDDSSMEEVLVQEDTVGDIVKPTKEHLDESSIEAPGKALNDYLFDDIALSDNSPSASFDSNNELIRSSIEDTFSSNIETKPKSSEKTLSKEFKSDLLISSNSENRISDLRKRLDDIKNKKRQRATELAKKYVK